MRKTLSRAALATMIATVGMSGVAQAKAGDKTFEQTYPVASKLCARADAGTLGKKLEANRAAVEQACATLRNGFPPLQSAVQSAQTQFATGVANAKAGVKAACAPPATKAQCKSARREGRATLKGLRQVHRAAVRLYFTSVEANRRNFWATIHALRGAGGLPADHPVAQQTA